MRVKVRVGVRVRVKDSNESRLDLKSGFLFIFGIKIFFLTTFSLTLI